jgi:hypothetical protein
MVVGLLFAVSAVSATEFKVDPEALSEWTFYGEGFVAEDAQGQFTVLAETPGSKGVMLVSPESYAGDFELSYKIRPLTPESVLVAILSASDRGAAASLSFPLDYDGSMGYLTTDLDNYFIAFHNAAHGKAPFIRKYSQESIGKEELVIAASNVMTTEWHDVEVGRNAGRIWLKIDDKTLVEATDEAMLGEGHIIFRLRGTPDRMGVSLIKDVKIEVDD